MANVKEIDSYDHPPLDTLNIFYNLENAFQYRNGVFLFERLTNLFFRIFFILRTGLRFFFKKLFIRHTHESVFCIVFIRQADGSFSFKQFIHRKGLRIFF